MAARIPSFADLGINDPRAAISRPQYPANDPASVALGVAGQGLQQAGGAALRIAAQQEDDRQALNEASATTDFVNRLVPLHTKIALASDPNEIAGLKEQYNTLLQTSAAAIDNPQRRAIWLSRHSNALLQAQSDADERIVGIERQNYGVGIERQLDGLIENAKNSPDGRAFDVAKMAGQTLIDAAGKYGLNPQWVYQRQRQFEHALETAGTGARVGGAAQRALGIGGNASGGVSPIGKGTGEGHVAPQAERVAFARDYAASKGINPDAVQATMAGEGLGKYSGDGGTSFGDFQLHVGGGMGDKALEAGINIRDPNTWREQTKFAIDQMAANRDRGAAWYAGQWHGAPGWAASSFAQASGGPPITSSDILQVDQSQPNRTGLPPLSQVWQSIVTDPRLRNEQEQLAAFQKARITYDAMEADAARAERIAAQQRRAQDEQIEGQIISDAASPTPQWTAQGVMADERLSPEARMRMLNFLSAVSRKANDHDTNTYGPGFNDAFQAIHAPDGAANKITSPDQLYSRVGPGGDLTVAGLEKLRGELLSKRTPEGEAAATMKKQFLDGARKNISGADPFLHIRDPKGEELYLKFLAQVLPAYDEGLSKGKSPAMMLNPDSPDYLGKIIPQFIRSPQDRAADMLGDVEPAAPKSANPADYKSSDDLIRAVQAGVVPYDAGVAEARKRGYIPAAPSVPLR